MNVFHYIKLSQIPYIYVMVVSSILFISVLIGVLSRPDGLLMSIVWPADAILIAFLLRYPHRSVWSVLSGAVVGYMLANYVTGEPFLPNLLLTIVNLSGVVVAWWLYVRVFNLNFRLNSRYSILNLFILCICCSVISALFGALMMVVLMDQSYLVTMIYWFTGDLSSMITVLPAALAFPKQLKHIKWKWELHDVLPLMMIFVSLVMMFALGGPGAIAFPVFALIWCALSYSFFVNTIIVMLFSIFLFTCEVFGFLPLFSTHEFVNDTISFRLGVTMMVLAPLSVSSINDARTQLIRKLDHAVNHDHLTNVLSRKAFEQKGESLLNDTNSNQRHLALLMMDLDFFKQINDKFGHQGGDELLVRFAHLVSDIIPSHCLWGRMGGEEFAAFIPDSSCERVSALAEQIRQEVSNMALEWADDQSICMTVSIGVACTTSGSTHWGELVEMADKALYQAKNQGRNRVCYCNC